MRIASIGLLFFAVFMLNIPASAECWNEDGSNRTAVELTACFMAEIQYCEDEVPGFKGKANAGIAKLEANAEYKKIQKSKEFPSTKAASRQYIASHAEGKPACDAILRKVQSGRF